MNSSSFNNTDVKLRVIYEIVEVPAGYKHSAAYKFAENAKNSNAVIYSGKVDIRTFTSGWGDDGLQAAGSMQERFKEHVSSASEADRPYHHTKVRIAFGDEGNEDLRIGVENTSTGKIYIPVVTDFFRGTRFDEAVAEQYTISHYQNEGSNMLNKINALSEKKFDHFSKNSVYTIDAQYGNEYMQYK